MAEHDVNYGGKKYTVTGADNYSDAVSAAARQSDVDRAIDIMTGGGGKSLADSLRDAADRAESKAEQAQLDKEQRKEEAQVVNSLVEFYCAENWDAIINTKFYGRFYQIAFALVVIACCKKGNSKLATQLLEKFHPHFIYDEWKEELSANALKVLSEWDSDKWNWEKNEGMGPDDYLKEMVKQACSKSVGRKVSDTEFNQSKLIIYEKEIRELYAIMNDLYEHRLSNATALRDAHTASIFISLGKWANLQGKEILTLTEEDMQKIAGNNAKLLDFLLYLRKAQKPSKAKKIVLFIVIVLAALFIFAYTRI